MCAMLKGHDLWKYINATTANRFDDLHMCELYDKESDIAYSLILHSIDNGKYIHTDTQNLLKKCGIIAVNSIRRRYNINRLFLEVW